jgi:hypothetical protein
MLAEHTSMGLHLTALRFQEKIAAQAPAKAGVRLYW